MAFLGMGKKKEDQPPGGIFPDMGLPPMDQYGQAGGQQAQQQDAYYGQQQFQQPMQQAQQSQPQYGQSYPQPQGANQADQHTQTEEIAEAIINEKWHDVEKEFGKLSEWKEDVNTKIIQLTQRVDDLKTSFDSLHKTMLGKIGEYDENLTQVGTEIKAMEKVFSKVLPSLTDSVNKLQRYSGSQAARPMAPAAKRVQL